MTATATLKRTPFHGFHEKHGAKLVDYTGWEMPLHYGSIIDEHKQVRESGGMFDVSHMGRFRFKGRDARRFLDMVCTRQIHGMQQGQVRYSLVCNQQGGCRDDVLVYLIDEGEYVMVCNAANRAKLIEHFEQVRGDMIFKFADETESTGMVALQGPNVMDMIGKFSSEIPTLKRYRFAMKNMMIAKVMISRTGYTGEDGVEVILPKMFAPKAVDMLLKEAGEDATIKPCGLGARDSLRLEAGMALYGHEITEEIDPITAGLNFAVKVDKGADDPEIGRFIGQDVIEKIAADGPKRTLTGLLLDSRRAARQGMTVRAGGSEIGTVTSGCFSPTLARSIAMAIIDTPHTEPGTTVHIDLGRTEVEAEVTPLPFYKAP